MARKRNARITKNWINDVISLFDDDPCLHASMPSLLCDFNGRFRLNFHMIKTKASIAYCVFDCILLPFNSQSNIRLDYRVWPKIWTIEQLYFVCHFSVFGKCVSCNYRVYHKIIALLSIQLTAFCGFGLQHHNRQFTISSKLF